MSDEMGSGARDRDEAGRPRSTRPRDELGRPLPYGSRGVERIPDELDLSPVEFLERAQELLDRGLAFNAHEVLEAAWKASPAQEKQLWQGLAQFAVGITHVQRGNLTGAATVLRRAANGLVTAHAPGTYPVDVAGVIEHAKQLIADLDAGVEIEPGRLRPVLLSR